MTDTNTTVVGQFAMTVVTPEEVAFASSARGKYVGLIESFLSSTKSGDVVELSLPDGSAFTDSKEVGKIYQGLRASKAGRVSKGQSIPVGIRKNGTRLFLVHEEG